MVAAKATREALVLFSLLVNLSFRAVNSSALDGSYAVSASKLVTAEEPSPATEHTARPSLYHL